MRGMVSARGDDEMKGYAGQILRINLSNDSIKKELLSEDVIKKFVGGSGFCAYYLTKELSPDIKPFDEENKIMFAVGPFTATLWPQSSRYSVASISPLTNGWGEAHSGGFWAAELKRAGYDGIIIEGKAEKPSYIEIEDDNVKIKDASHVWGKDVKEMTNTLRKDSDYKVVGIGRAGENLVRVSCIISDYHRAAARCGLGAVMGSKNLKAIAFKGSKSVTVDNPKKYLKTMKKIRDKLLKNQYAKEYPNYGTLLLPGLLNNLGRSTWYNAKDSTFKTVDKVNGIRLREERILKSRACGGCMLRCAQVVSIEKPKSIDNETTEGVEYESVAALGPRCGNDDIKSILKGNNLCNDLGLDTMGIGGTISWAMECYQNNILTKKDTEGLELNWGDKELILKLIEDIALRRTKLGNLLAEGSQKAADTLGKGHEYLMTVKSAETSNVDPRAQKSMGLAYAVCPRGADHLYAFLVIEYPCYKKVLSERFGAKIFKDLCDGLSNKAKPYAISVSENFGTLIDSLGICKYGTMVPPILYYNDISEALQVTCGMKTDRKSLEKVGERVANLNRLFNIRRGFSMKDDTLPRRYLHEKASSGLGKGHVVDLKPMLEEYYAIRGWEKDGTIPKEKLTSLGLEEFY